MRLREEKQESMIKCKWMNRYGEFFDGYVVDFKDGNAIVATSTGSLTQVRLDWVKVEIPENKETKEDCERKDGECNQIELVTK